MALDKTYPLDAWVPQDYVIIASLIAFLLIFGYFIVTSRRR